MHDEHHIGVILIEFFLNLTNSLPQIMQTFVIITFDIF